MSSSSGSHRVHFYERALFPSKHIAEFVHKGIEQNEAIVLVASEAHAVQIGNEVGALGSSIRSLRSAGLWSVVNTDILLRALQSGLPIKRLIENAINPTFKLARQKSRTDRIRVYGELADEMLKLGKPDACLELERYGNQIVSEDVADIYCGYSADAFPDAGCARQFTKVCLLHNLIHTNLKDQNDWRYRMALGLAQTRNDTV
jgi:hypothetical protein